MNWQISHRDRSLSAYSLWTRIKRKVLLVPSRTQGHVHVSPEDKRTWRPLSSSVGLLPSCRMRMAEPKADVRPEAAWPSLPVRKRVKVTVASHSRFSPRELPGSYDTGLWLDRSLAAKLRKRKGLEIRQTLFQLCPLSLFIYRQNLECLRHLHGQN